ncbi:MAG: hypothetical protein OCU18_03705 [Candidatus Syntrophoarchaeum sp.]|nr:hypothetical protein [Candidatus Syntrophoarchaeum sp.]
MRYLEEENPFIWVRFATTDSVTITIYKAIDNSVVVDAAAMSELLSTGYFKYQFSPSPAPVELTEYFYIATNGIEEHAGKIILGGYPDSIKNETDKIQTDIIDAKADYKATGFSTHSAADVKSAMEASGSDLDYLVKALVNKLVITEASGDAEMFDDANGSLGSVLAAFTSDGTYTTRKRMVI